MPLKRDEVRIYNIVLYPLYINCVCIIVSIIVYNVSYTNAMHLSDTQILYLFGTNKEFAVTSTEKSFTCVSSSTSFSHRNV